MSDAPGILEGGCHCGAVRYRVQGNAAYTVFCHCTDCRRTSGAPMVAWVGFPGKDITILSGEPARYASSDVAERRFCSHCGTPLFYKHHKSEIVDITIASLDDPETSRPEFHVFTRSRLSWIRLNDGLTRYPGWKHEGNPEAP